MKEEYKTWKETLNSIYEVSNYGNVKINGMLVEDFKIFNGYKMFCGKFLHRIVAELFVPNPENKPQVDHIDTNRLNCRADNLRWCTQSENMQNKITVQLWQDNCQKYYDKHPEAREKRSYQFKNMWANFTESEINNIKNKQSLAHKNKTYVNKDGERLHIYTKDLLYYLEQGYIYGRRPLESKIRVYKDGHLKRIERPYLLEYINNGWKLGCMLTE